MLSFAALKFLVIGSFFGLAAGISPGPLLTLVIAETLKHNKAEGIKIAVTPLITDLPIILITIYVFSRLLEFQSLLSIISITGGIYLLFLGYKTIISGSPETELNAPPSGSLVKGIMANFFSPHPYLFWITIGSPYVLKAKEINFYAVVYFLASFYFFLIGSKIIVALLAARSKTFLKELAYLWVMRLLGLTLIVFAGLFIYEGLKYFLTI